MAYLVLLHLMYLLKRVEPKIPKLPFFFYQYFVPPFLFFWIILDLFFTITFYIIHGLIIYISHFVYLLIIILGFSIHTWINISLPNVKQKKVKISSLFLYCCVIFNFYLLYKPQLIIIFSLNNELLVNS